MGSVIHRPDFGTLTRGRRRDAERMDDTTAAERLTRAKKQLMAATKGGQTKRLAKNGVSLASTTIRGADE